MISKKVVCTLSFLTLNLISAKNFDVAQPVLIDSFNLISPNSVFFNTINGQTLGYVGKNSAQGVSVPGTVTVFSLPFTIQGEFSMGDVRGMVFNSFNSVPYLYGSSVDNSNYVIAELNGFSGQLVKTIPSTNGDPEFFLKKTLGGEDYGYNITYGSPGYITCLSLTGSSTQVAGSTTIGALPFFGAFNPFDDNYIYVPNTGDSTLSIVPLSGTILNSSISITLGGTPSDICLGGFPEGIYGYVTNRVSGLNILSVDGGNVSVVGTISDQGPFNTISSIVLDNKTYGYAFAGSKLFLYELNPGTCTLLNVLDTPNIGLENQTKMSFQALGQNTYGYLPFSSADLLQLYLIYQKPFMNYPGNTGVISDLLNDINNDGCLSSTQDVIDYLFMQDNPFLGSCINQLAPAFKIAQYSLEKLDYTLHKQLDTKLYQDKKENDIFILAGYDHLSQSGTSVYNRYNVDNFFQVIGGNYQFKDMKVLAALGASESYMKVHPVKAQAQYPTIWSALGFMGSINNWTLGIDGLFGYSFLQTKRGISFLNQKALSNHNAWNLSFEGKISYKFTDDNMLFKPYDTIGYIYGHESDYQEHGADGVNLRVKNENLSVLRNALGFEFNAPKNTSIKGVFDLAWVWDYYFTSTSYQAAFVGTDEYGIFKTVQPTRNYGRVNVGVEGVHSHFDWKILYTGLYGKKFSENTLTLELGYRF